MNTEKETAAYVKYNVKCHVSEDGFCMKADNHAEPLVMSWLPSKPLKFEA